MPNITKHLFLSTLRCRTYGWLQHHQPIEQPTSPADQLRIEEGIEIHDRAKSLYPNGVLISGNNISCIKKTKELLANPQTTTIFEATFQTIPYITKADILIRDNSKWKLIEIKSAVNQGDKHVDDIGRLIEIKGDEKFTYTLDGELYESDGNLRVEMGFPVEFILV